MERNNTALRQDFLIKTKAKSSCDCSFLAQNIRYSRRDYIGLETRKHALFLRVLLEKFGKSYIKLIVRLFLQRDISLSYYLGAIKQLRKAWSLSKVESGRNKEMLTIMADVYNGRRLSITVLARIDRH